MLRQHGTRNPDARFSALLQTLVSKYALPRPLHRMICATKWKTVMTPGMDLEGDRSMEWFFEEWVRGTGIPTTALIFTARHTRKAAIRFAEALSDGRAALLHRQSSALFQWPDTALCSARSWQPAGNIFHFDTPNLRANYH